MVSRYSKDLSHKKAAPSTITPSAPALDALNTLLEQSSRPVAAQYGGENQDQDACRNVKRSRHKGTQQSGYAKDLRESKKAEDTGDKSCGQTEESYSDPGYHYPQPVAGDLQLSESEGSVSQAKITNASRTLSENSVRFNPGGNGSNIRTPSNKMKIVRMYKRGRTPGSIRGGSNRNVMTRQSRQRINATLIGEDVAMPTVPSRAASNATEKGRAKVSEASSEPPGRLASLT